jgi:hypothetical protein
MYDSLLASSIAESYDGNLTTRANWKKFEKQFLSKGATRAEQVSMEFTDNLPNGLLNVKLIRLRRQRGVNTFAGYCISPIPNLLTLIGDCLSFDDLRQKLVNLEAPQQLTSQRSRRGSSILQYRQRGRDSYQSLRSQLTAARGGGVGNHASSRATASTPRDGEWFDCTRCKKGHPWPCYFDPQLPNHKNLDWWHGDPTDVAGTTSGKRDRHGYHSKASLRDTGEIRRQ